VDEVLSAFLSAQTMEYLFAGLDTFMAEILIRNLPSIRVCMLVEEFFATCYLLTSFFLQRINNHGVKKAMRGIFALQQNLTTVMKSRAVGYNSYFTPISAYS
jgi:hypothetical protein